MLHRQATGDILKYYLQPGKITHSPYFFLILSAKWREETSQSLCPAVQHLDDRMFGFHIVIILCVFLAFLLVSNVGYMYMQFICTLLRCL